MVRDCTPQFGPGAQQVLVVLTVTASILSLMGTFLVVVFYVYLPTLHNHSHKLVVFLSLCGIGSSIALLGTWHHASSEQCAPATTACSLGGLGLVYFDLATFGWTCVVAYNARLILVLGQWRRARDLLPVFHWLCWGLPAVFLGICLVVSGLSSFGDSGNWCWISPHHELLELFVYILPLSSAIAFVVAFNTSTYLNRSRIAASQTVEDLALSRALMTYGLIFAVTRVFGAICSVVTWLDSTPPFWLLALHSFFSPIQGFLNAILYGRLTKIVWDVSGLGFAKLTDKSLKVDSEA